MGVNVVRLIPKGIVMCFFTAASKDSRVTLRTTYPSSVKATLEYAGFECNGKTA